VPRTIVRRRRPLIASRTLKLPPAERGPRTVMGPRATVVGTPWPPAFTPLAGLRTTGDCTYEVVYDGMSLDGLNCSSVGTDHLRGSLPGD